MRVSRGFISASAHRLPSYELLTGSTARRCESIAPQKPYSILQENTDKSLEYNYQL
jgi:hypothetical protein